MCPLYGVITEDVEEDDSEKHEEDLDDDGDTACWANDNNFGTVDRGLLRKYQKLSHSENTCRSQSAEVD